MSPGDRRARGMSLNSRTLNPNPSLGAAFAQEKAAAAAQAERRTHQEAALAALSQNQSPEPRKHEPVELRDERPPIPEKETQEKERRKSRRFSLHSLKGLVGLEPTEAPPPMPAPPPQAPAQPTAPARAQTQPLPQARAGATRTKESKPRPPTLNTKIAPANGPNTAPAKPTNAGQQDEDDELEDIIAMSPVTSVGVQKFRRSRSSLVLYSANGSSSQVNLNSGLSPLSENSTPEVYQPTKRRRSRSRTSHASEATSSGTRARTHPASRASTSHTSHTPSHHNSDEKIRERRDSSHHHSDEKLRERRGSKAYFGQNVSQFDLIANNIENAFTSMR